MCSSDLEAIQEIQTTFPANQFDNEKFSKLLNTAIEEKTNKKGVLLEIAITYLFDSHKPYFNSVKPNVVTSTNQFDVIVMQDKEIGITELGNRWIIECKNRLTKHIESKEVDILGHNLIKKGFKTGIIVTTCNRISPHAKHSIRQTRFSELPKNVLFFLLEDLEKICKGESLIEMLLKKYSALALS